MTSGRERAHDEEPPGRSLDVAPTSLRASGGGRRRGVVVLVLVAGVIAGAVAIAQVPRDAHRQVALVAPSPSAVSSGDPSSPSPEPVASVLDATSARMRPSDLAAAVRDGTLDGRLVFVDGELSVRSVDCDNLATVRRGCIDLTIPGLGLPVRAAAPSLVWMRMPHGAWLVTVARGGTLVYLGSLVPDREVPTGLPELARRLGNPAPGSATGTLFETNGTLLTGAPFPCSGTCPSEPPTLAGPILLGDQSDTTGTVVDVAKNTPEVDMTAQWLDGPFLVARSSDPGGWRVVARYVPSRAVRVLVP